MGVANARVRRPADRLLAGRVRGDSRGQDFGNRTFYAMRVCAMLGIAYIGAGPICGTSTRRQTPDDHGIGRLRTIWPRFSEGVLWILRLASRQTRPSPEAATNGGRLWQRRYGGFRRIQARFRLAGRVAAIRASRQERLSGSRKIVCLALGEAWGISVRWKQAGHELEKVKAGPAKTRRSAHG